VDFDEWLKSFRADYMKPIYIIAAQEYFLTRRVVERIKEALWGEIQGETNYQRLDGAEVALAELLEAVNTIPFFGSRRLIILDSAHAFVDRLGNKERESLRGYLASPSPTTTLVMVFDATDRRKWTDKYRKWAGEIKGQGDFIDCKVIYENQVPEWVRRIAEHMGLRLNQEILDYLSVYMSTDIQSIYSELEKLAVHAASDRTLTLENVQEIVGDRRQGDIFTFQHHLGKGDTAAALQMLDKLLGEGEEGHKLLNRMYYYFKQLMLIKELDGRGQATPGSVSKITRNRYGKTNQRFIEESRRFSEEELLNVFPRLLEADIELKTGGPRADDLLPPLVAELCGLKQPSGFTPSSV
jgi:DNA polymerase-3 subunit delta